MIGPIQPSESHDIVVVSPPPIIETVSSVLWTSLYPSIVNPLQNTKQQYLKFVNTHLFSEEARHFLKYGYYTNAPIGSKDYDDYWDEQERRCIEGYSIAGTRITGRHYFYLNFGKIRALPTDPLTGLEKRGAKKIITFPRFLDHQYYLFHELEECFAEGPYSNGLMIGMCLLKSRRKGATYCISIGVYDYNYFFIPASTNVLAAFEKKHFKVTLDGIHFTKNHINNYTDWAKRSDKMNTREHFRASFTYKNDLGYDIEDGYMSEVQAVSFKDDPFKSIGEAATVMGFEEAGRFVGLLEAYGIAEPTLRDGDVFTGIPLFWGTGGDMGAGAVDLTEIFYNPAVYGCKSYDNTYDENATGECGFFIDDLWYYTGDEGGVSLVDKDGNSERQLASKALEKKDEIKKKGTAKSYNLFRTQQPRTPAEALLQSQGSRFDTVTAKNVLATMLANPRKYVDTIRKGHFDVNLEDGRPYFVEGKDDVPVLEFPFKDNKNKPGCTLMFEGPVRSMDGIIERTRYIAAVDVYDDDESSTKSLGSMFVLDRLTDRIVAHYKGRPDATTFYEQCRRLAMYYNAVLVYERNKKGLYGYFYNKGALTLLADEPEILKEKGISSSNTTGNNSKGIHATAAVNGYGLELAELWMGEPAYGEPEDSPLTRLHKVRSIPFLREIMFHNGTGNFDDISAFGLLMIYREDTLKYRVTGKINKEKKADAYLSKWKTGSPVAGLRARTRIAIGLRKN